jgi:hypothetical protein
VITRQNRKKLQPVRRARPGSANFDSRDSFPGKNTTEDSWIVMSLKNQGSSMKSAVAALATFAVLVWGGVGVKVAMLRGATRQMAVAPSTSSRPSSFDRKAENPRAISAEAKKSVAK